MKLTVYKASAGSGKTYTLTREYLKQALRYANNPYIFRTILAVTFTNKATEEMKNRIINTLNSIVDDGDNELSNYLKTELNINEIELQDRAQKVRSAILHNYTYFSISTIDTFFQKIIHAFVREAGLRPGFNLELDTNRLLEQGVDLLLQETSNNDVLRKWLFSIIENRIEDRSSWDMRPLLLSLGTEVFSENFRRFEDDFHLKTGDKQFMDNYAKNLNKTIAIFNNKMREIGNKALSTIQLNRLESSDFKFGTSGFINFFYKIAKGNFDEPKKRVYDALECFDGWVSKNSKRVNEVEAIYPILLPLLIEGVEYWQTHHKQYNTACEINRKFLELGVLTDIDRHIKNIANEENIMPINDSVHLLSTLINESDTPFVYERTGNRYKTFMIDEFQDTSAIQWKIFLPLLHNSLAENQFSMVVGDVKQSIYRWRNGDWRILAYNLPHDLNAFGINEQNLSINWRSKPTIIEFNNILFKQFSQYLQLIFNNTLNESSSDISSANKKLLHEIIITAYADTEQKIPPKTQENTGFVSINTVEQEDELTSNEKVLENLPNIIIDLQNRGYRPNDIAILTRRREEGQLVTDFLLKYKKKSKNDLYCFDVISQDSLFISNATCVKIIIATMRLTINSNDSITSAFLRHQLATIQNTKTLNLHNIFCNQNSEAENEFINYLSSLSLNEVFEALVKHYKLNENKDELPFLQELHDLISNFSNRKISDISTFIEWWDDKGKNSTLSPGKNQRAINIMTIHKSKGLQFPAVIIPFANWSIEPKLGTTIWVSPKNEPFNNLPHVPLMYSKALENTDFNTEYLTEKVQSYIDNINLLYVAFTRAEDELYINMPKGKKENKSTISSLLSDFFKHYIGSEKNFIFEKLQGVYKSDELSIVFGSKKNYNAKEQTTQGVLLSNYPTTSFNQKLRLRYESENYFNNEPHTPLQRRNYGVLMHRIFADIPTIDDYETAIDKLFNEGLIDLNDKNILIKKIEKALQHPNVQEWFTNKWQIKTETGVLIPSDKSNVLIQRPDRVMIGNNETLVIDYKFGLIEESRYNKQLNRYASLLRSMNYPNVKAYIWYVDLEKVIEV